MTCLTISSTSPCPTKEPTFALNKAKEQSPQFAETLRIAREKYGHKYEPDLDWETYIVQQGIRLCFKQAGKQDVFVDIPRQTTNGATLTFQPWPQVCPTTCRGLSGRILLICNCSGWDRVRRASATRTDEGRYVGCGRDR
ncbi:hypothetical protein FPV67DRAFT_638408 [Lyophyllum atratum]|nr:hypothetical protein FPV67DRAFT_638408 [Lyophyllum atratum]